METSKGEKEQSKFSTPMLLFGKGFMGVFAGYLVGSFTKQITDIAAFYAGMGVLFVGGLHYMHWITINWKEIDEDLLHLYVRAKTASHDKGLVARMKRFALRTLPLMGGFVVGFKIAWHLGQ